MTSTPTVTIGPHERENVYGVCFRILKHPDDAEDACQEALALAWQHRAGFKGEAKLSTWLHRIAVTTCLMRVRYAQRRPPSYRGVADADEIIDALLDGHADPEQLAVAHEQARVAAATVATLGVSRAATEAKLLGYTEAEIAAELGLTDCTVKTRCHRGILTLRRAIASGDVPQRRRGGRGRQAKVLRLPRAKMLIEAFGERLSAPAWARRFGISHALIHYRVAHGWNHERAVSEPPKAAKRDVVTGFALRRTA